MPKAVILFSFKKDDPSPLLKELSHIRFDRKDGRRTIFSKEFSVDEVELDLGQLKAVKDSIVENATYRIGSPFRIWKEAFKAAGLDPTEAALLAGLATAKKGTVSSVATDDTTTTKKETVSSVATDDTAMDDTAMDEAAIPEAKSPVAAELRQEESQSQGIVDNDFDVDALVSGLAKTKLGGRRRTRRAKKLRRRYSRKA
jgi:hypothetical protein